MFKKFSTGFAVGYVFGARAGKKRYEQIIDLSQRVLDSPAVGWLTEEVTDRLGPEPGRHLADQVAQKVGQRFSGNGARDEDDSGENDSYVEDSYDAEDVSAESGDEDSEEESDEEGRDDDDDQEANDETSEEERPRAERTQRRREKPRAPRSNRRRSGDHPRGVKAAAAAARERGRVD